ncbi:SRPBCC family protein [Ferruginibacter sp. SUN002]|uniref:SRPBCC family protein n=1 Tax=Ferruginibacter sp. SUN002 TaxID=2937789 RepID=UPI003D36880B
MSTIHLTTFIAAPVERVFDLSRSINLHKISTADTKEEAVAGRMSGLINEGEKVTWKAKHLFKTRFFTSKISSMKLNESFTDEMEKGDFKSYKHEHHFKQVDNGTIIIDLIEFESPYGVIGQLFNQLYLKRYLEALLIKRNNVIKEYAETQKWQAFLNYYN